MSHMVMCRVGLIVGAFKEGCSAMVAERLMSIFSFGVQNTPSRFYRTPCASLRCDVFLSDRT
jgi:hypothetical protein